MKISALICGLLFSCSVLFAQISAITELDGPGSEYSPTIHPDGHILVFQSVENGEWRLWGSYASANGWGTPFEVFPGLPPGSFLGGPAFSANGNMLVFFSDAFGDKESLDLVFTTYDQKSRRFSKPEPFPAPVNTSGYEAFPSVSADGSTLYFVRDAFSEEWEEGDLDCYEIMVSHQNDTGDWSIPVSITEALGGDCVGYPRIMPDGETLIFSRIAENGLHDLMMSRSDGNSWTTPLEIPALNSEEDDKMVSSTYNGSSLILTRSKEDGELFDADMLVEGPGSLLPDIAGWAYVDVRVTTPEGNLLPSTISHRLRNSEEDGLAVEIASSGSSLVRLRSGKEYLMTMTAEDHDFRTIPIDFRNTMRPDTLSVRETLTPLKKEVTITIDNLTFEYNSADITDSAAAILDIAALFLQKNEGVKVEIAAHTDDVGSPEFNLDLSNQRAEAVVEALVERGASRERLVAKGYGESDPIADNTTEEGQAQNRRVEFRILEE